MLAVAAVGCQPPGGPPVDDDGSSPVETAAETPPAGLHGAPERGAPAPVPALIGAPPAEASRSGELEIVATTFNPTGGFPEGVPVHSVTYDANIRILIRVEEVLRGDSPFEPGQEVGLLVHSPVLMFGGYDFDGKSFVYTFAVLEHQDGSTSYVLTGLETWPRSPGSQ